MNSAQDPLTDIGRAIQMDAQVLFGYRLLLKAENWKYCSKIIFKYVNSAVGSIFNESFVEKKGLWIPWTMHGTYCQTLDAAEKKKISAVSKRSLKVCLDIAYSWKLKTL